MNDAIKKYVEDHAVYINQLSQYNKGDRLCIYNSTLYELVSNKDFYVLFNDDNGETPTETDYFIIQTSKSEGSYNDPQYLFYKRVDPNMANALLGVEYINDFKKHYSSQINQLDAVSRKIDKLKSVEDKQNEQTQIITALLQTNKSINGKLTFFVILTIVNIIASVILALR